MLDPTLSDVVFLRSIKKFFLDFLTPAGIPTFFDFIETPPKVPANLPATGMVPADKWISIIPRATDMGVLSDHLFYIHFFVRNDVDQEKLAEFRDFLIENLVDLTQTDGRRRINFYDSTWNVLFTGVLQPRSETAFERFDDGIRMKTLPVTAYWGGK